MVLEYGLDVSRHKGKTGHSDYMGKEGMFTLIFC